MPLILAAAFALQCSGPKKMDETQENERRSAELKSVENLLADIYRSPRAAQWQETPPSIIEQSAAALAWKIRAGELSSEQCTAAFLGQIVRLNPRYNAVVTLNAEQALQRARQLDEAAARGEFSGPLHGLPFTIKDTFQTRGLRTTAGSFEFTDYIPSQNAVVVERLLAAGAILMGKTNTPALALDMQTFNDVFGRTVNAHNPERSAGGSSGGAAVALALNMTPFEIGSDLAGSIRLPAAYNGVYGLKPGFGLVSLRGHLPPKPDEVFGVRHLAVVGPMTRSIEDLELLLEVIGGPGPGDFGLRILPPSRESAPAATELRIAWSAQLGDVPVAAEIETSLRGFVAAIERAGSRVKQDSPAGFDYVGAWETWGAIVGAQGGYDQSNFMRRLGAFFTRSAVANTPTIRRVIGPISVPGYMQALQSQDRFVDQLEGFLGNYDVWIVPVSATVAHPHLAPARRFGEFSVYESGVAVRGQEQPYLVATQSYTTIFSLTENPVIALPIGKDGQGMPIAVQLVGRRGQERRLLAVATVLDRIARGDLAAPPGAER